MHRDDIPPIRRTHECAITEVRRFHAMDSIQYNWCNHRWKLMRWDDFSSIGITHDAPSQKIDHIPSLNCLVHWNKPPIDHETQLGHRNGLVLGMLVWKYSVTIATATTVVSSWNWQLMRTASEQMSIKVLTRQTNPCITFIPRVKGNEDPNGVQNNHCARGKWRHHDPASPKKLEPYQTRTNPTLPKSSLTQVNEKNRFITFTWATREETLPSLQWLCSID